MSLQRRFTAAKDFHGRPLAVAGLFALFAFPLFAEAQKEERVGFTLTPAAGVCSTSGSSRTQPALRFTPAYGSTPWPLELVTDKTTVQINNLRQVPLTGGPVSVAGVLGLTRPVGPNFLAPFVSVTWEWTQATSREGWCAEISGGDVLSPRIQMYIASQYLASSCAFREIRNHEGLHYADLSEDLRLLQHAIRDRWSSIALPIAGRPWYLPQPAREDAEAAATSHLDGLIRSALQPITYEISARADQEGRQRDAVDLLDATRRKCQSW